MRVRVQLELTSEHGDVRMIIDGWCEANITEQTLYDMLNRDRRLAPSAPRPYWTQDLLLENWMHTKARAEVG